MERNRASLTAVTLRFWVLNDGTGDIDLGPNTRCIRDFPVGKKTIGLPKEVVEGLESIVNTVKFRAENAKKEIEIINKLLAKERRIPLEICHIIHGYVYDYHIFDILNKRGNNVKFGPNKLEFYRAPQGCPAQGIVKITFCIPSVYDGEEIEKSLSHLWERNEKFLCETDEMIISTRNLSRRREFEKMKRISCDHMEGESFSFPPTLQVILREERTGDNPLVTTSASTTLAGNEQGVREKGGRKRKQPDS